MVFKSSECIWIIDNSARSHGYHHLRNHHVLRREERSKHHIHLHSSRVLVHDRHVSLLFSTIGRRSMITVRIPDEFFKFGKKLKFFQAKFSNWSLFFFLSQNDYFGVSRNFEFSICFSKSLDSSRSWENSRMLGRMRLHVLSHFKVWLQ